MKKVSYALFLLTGICVLPALVSRLRAQPYVDPLQVRYTYGFRNSMAEATPFTHIWVGSDLPIKLRENTYLLISPYYEEWQIDSAGKKNIAPQVNSLAFPLGIMLPVGKGKWSLTFLPVARWNGEKLFGEKTFQFGGATLAGFVRKPGQQFRFGIYLNAEFFGLFVMPLAGCDWKIDNRNYLFGVLPGRLTYEHQWNEKLYWGATFRAITNSYRLNNGQFLRLDDNQVSLYLDFYPAKKFCLTLEPGYGLVRKIRTGTDSRDYLTKRSWGDGPFIKLSASYRIRLKAGEK